MATPPIPNEIQTRGPFRVAFEFPVLWSGWELDGTAWVVVDREGKRYLVHTHHGAPYVADRRMLTERAKEYEKVLGQTRDALNMIRGRRDRGV